MVWIVYIQEYLHIDAGIFLTLRITIWEGVEYLVLSTYLHSYTENCSTHRYHDHHSGLQNEGLLDYLREEERKRGL
jgi:hypothetical protein